MVTCVGSSLPRDKRPHVLQLSPCWWKWAVPQVQTHHGKLRANNVGDDRINGSAWQGVKPRTVEPVLELIKI